MEFAERTERLQKVLSETNRDIRRDLDSANSRLASEKVSNDLLRAKLDEADAYIKVLERVQEELISQGKIWVDREPNVAFEELLEKLLVFIRTTEGKLAGMTCRDIMPFIEFVYDGRAVDDEAVEHGAKLGPCPYCSSS
jgi:phage shock protein A